MFVLIPILVGLFLLSLPDGEQVAAGFRATLGWLALFWGSAVLGRKYYLRLGIAPRGEPDLEAHRISRYRLLGGGLLLVGVLSLISHALASSVGVGCLLGLGLGEHARREWDRPAAEPVSSAARGVWGREHATYRSHVADQYQEPQAAYVYVPPARPSYAPGDGRAFEMFVAALLREMGWAATVTGKGADSGVDVVATVVSGGARRKLVVQAKNLKSPAGRRAVQEAFTGKAEYGADEAWVVSTSGFTAQAKESARKLGVNLVTASQLRARADSHSRSVAEAARAREAQQAREDFQAREARAARARAKAEAAGAVKREQENTRAAEAVRADEAAQAAERVRAARTASILEARERAERQAELDAAAGERMWRSIKEQSNRS